jgi:hypothetical protein
MPTSFRMAFMDRFRSVPGLLPTHTLLGSGCLYVDDDDRSDFESRYVALLRRAELTGSFPCLTERPSALVFPVIADVDVKVGAIASAAPQPGDAVGSALAAGDFAASDVTSLVVDDCYARNTNWQMHGSTKPALAGDPYVAVATHAFRFATEEADAVERTATPVSPAAARDWPRWVALTRVRSMECGNPVPLLPAFEAEVCRREEAAARSEAERSREAAAAAERALANARPGDQAGHVAYVGRLLACLSTERTTAYKTWRNVARCSRATGPLTSLSGTRSARTRRTTTPPAKCTSLSGGAPA